MQFSANKSPYLRNGEIFGDLGGFFFGN